MKVMITGAAGFIGGFLTRYCCDAGHSVLGVDIAAADASLPGAFEVCDVRDARLAELVTAFRPDRIFHLAAQSFPTVSLVAPLETMDTNAGGTIHLYECVRAAGLLPTVVVACSSAEYGLVPSSELPVRETQQLRPLHPYGVSKVAQDLLAAQYFVNYGIPSVRMRIFNTTGPGKLGDVCSDLTKRAVEIELGLRPPVLMAGNLDTRRALIDVRDMVRGLWLAAERGAAGEVYNVGGNRIFAVQEVIDILRRKVKTPFTIQQDPKLVRACDEPVIAGDTSKFRECSGWVPEIDLARTLDEMLAWWRGRLAQQQASVSSGAAQLPV